MSQFILCPLFAFVLGSVPFGLLIGKARGIDIRQHGSGNIGATNVFRSVGKAAGLSCFILDFLKGFLPVLLARHLCTPLFVENMTAAQTVEVLTALSAVLGHNFSPWVGFRGGKGVATTFGAFSALFPLPGVLLVLAVWGVVTFTTRYVSLGSIAAAIALPLVSIMGSWRHGKLADGSWNMPLFLFSCIAGILAIWKHRSNIARLREGTEAKIGDQSQPGTSPNA